MGRGTSITRRRPVGLTASAAYVHSREPAGHSPKRFWTDPTDAVPPPDLRTADVTRPARGLRSRPAAGSAAARGARCRGGGTRRSADYEWLGTTEGFVDASVRAQVSGYLIARDYREGQLVKRGDLLFRIDPRPFQAALDQAQGQLASARATLERERLDVVRYTPLVKQGAVSQQEYDNAVQNERGAQASVQAAQAAVETAKINLGFTEIRSPVDGIVGVAQAQLGDFVGPSSAEPLTAVSQLDPIRVVLPGERAGIPALRAARPGGAPRRPFPRGLARAGPGGRQRLPAPRHRLPGRPRRRSAHRHHHREGGVPESGKPAAARPVRARARRDRRAQAAHRSSRSARCRTCRARHSSPWSDPTTRSKCAPSSGPTRERCGSSKRASQPARA